ncbi:MAG TPA: hypothetical protein VM802_07025 [Chitinophaga sp.]|uniref:hypothetical protein n=1 Tax=Chitinophaga sp. TaxID=1869181 RepID=UPI002BF8FFE0|nr:hypothetical protein [Chitinophaga sp.]HVI44602.1 hypothetical protein [Chitinophaga sp.]
MSIEIKRGKGGRALGIYLPLRDWVKVHHNVKAYTAIYELAERYAPVDPILKGILDRERQAGLDLNLLELQEKVEQQYLSAFREGKPRYYQDDNCVTKDHFMRENPDGSEDLVHFDYSDEAVREVVLAHVAPAGAGRYAYLLADPRFRDNKTPL